METDVPRPLPRTRLIAPPDIGKDEEERSHDLDGGRNQFQTAQESNPHHEHDEMGDEPLGGAVGRKQR